MDKLLIRLGIQPGEGPLVGRLTGVFATFVFALLLGRSIRDSLFLSAGFSKQLPLMYVGVAGIVIAATLSYKKMRRSGDPVIDAQRLAIVFGISFILLYGLAQTAVRTPAIVAMYFWVEIMTALLMIQFWTVANAYFNPREAKRLYTVITSGQVAGNLLCGAAAALLAPIIGTEILLFIVSFSLFLSLAFLKTPEKGEDEAQGARANNAKERTPRKTDSQTKKYGQLLIAITAVTYVTASLVDYGFKLAANTRYDQDELTRFFGLFYGGVGTAAFVVQLFLANRLVRLIGLFGTLSIMPIGFALLGGIRASVTSFWIQIGLKFDEHLLRYSINDPLSQLLLIPLPSHAKSELQQYLGGVVKPFAIGISGLVMLGLGFVASSASVDATLRVVAGAVALLSLVWLVLLWRSRRLYIAMLSKATQSFRQLDSVDQTWLAGDSAKRTIESVLADANGNDTRKLSLALQAAETGQIPVTTEVLTGLFTQENEPEIKAHALWLLSRTDKENTLYYASQLYDRPGILGETALICLYATDSPMSRGWTDTIVGRANPIALSRLISIASDKEYESWHPIAIDAALDRLTEPSTTTTEFAVLARLVPTEEMADTVRERAESITANDANQGFVANAFEDAVAKRPAAYDDQWLAAADAAIMGGKPAVQRLAAAWLLEQPEVSKAIERLPMSDNPSVSNSMEAWSEPLTSVWVASAHVDHVAAMTQRLGDLNKASAVLWEYWTRPLCEENAAAADLKNSFERAPIDAWFAEAEMFANAMLRANMQDIGGWLLPSLEAARTSRLSAIMRWAACMCGDNELMKASHPAVVGRSANMANLAEMIDQTFQHPRKASLVALLEEADGGIEVDFKDLPWALEEQLVKIALSSENGDVVDTLERTMQLAKVDLFQGLPLQSLAKIAAITEDVPFKSGEVIIEDGADGDSLYLLTNGAVEVRKGGKTLVKLENGACFGEMSLLDDQPRSADVVGVESCNCLRIWRDDFEVLLLDEPQIGRAIMHVLTGRLRVANTQNK